jgi:hypothetical protein
MIPMMKLMGPRISYGGMADCHGAVYFNAELLKANYFVPIVLIAGVFAELGALGMMVNQVIKAVRNKKESSELAVG